MNNIDDLHPDLTSPDLVRLKLLREPFLPHQISKLPRPYKKDSPKGNCKDCGGYHGLPAMHLDYVGHAALTDRLLEVDPEWEWQPVAWTAEGLPCLDKDGGLWIRLRVCGLVRLGYGDAQGKTGGDAMKERIGDALRNAAMRFGCALDLWHKGDLHPEGVGNGSNGAIQPEPQRPPDDHVVKCLKECETPEQLNKYWKSLPEALRITYTPEKEEAKRRLGITPRAATVAGEILA